MYAILARVGIDGAIQSLLIILDGFEQLREVALPEAAASSRLIDFLSLLKHAAHPLNDLQKDGWPISNGFGKDLNQHTFIVVRY